MPKTHHLQLNHQLSGDFEIIYHSLLDFRKFGKIHEFITEVNLTEDKSPEYIKYKIFEEIYLLGFIKNKPIYEVKVYEIEKNKHIRYVSQVKKNIELIIDMHFENGPKSTIQIQEKFQVKANLIIGKYFLKILQKAHLQFFKNLKKILQNSIEDVTH